MSDRMVDCGSHGKRAPAFICGHALKAAIEKRPQAFYLTSLDDDEPCGWCDACHARYLAEGEEWNERSEAGLDLQVVCVDCFREIAKLNGSK